MEIALSNWLALMTVAQMCYCYRLLYLPGLLDEPSRKYIMNFGGELALAGPTLQNMASMYVVVHRRHLLFYTGGMYYGFGLGEDRVNVRLMPAGLTGGAEFFEHDVHSGIEYFTKSLVEKTEPIAPTRVKRWGSWSKEAGTKTNGEEASVVHEEEVSSNYGGRGAVRRTSVEKRTVLQPRIQPRIISTRESTLRTGLHGGAMRGERWEERTLHNEDKVGRGLDERYVIQKGRGHPTAQAEETNEAGETVVGRDGHSVGPPLADGSTAEGLLYKLQSMLNQVKNRGGHLPFDHARIPHRDEIESDSDMAEKTNLDVTVHTLSPEQKTFYLKSKSDLCVTLYKNSFIMAECSNATGQVFRLDDAALVAQKLRRKPKAPGRPDWENAHPRQESSEDSPEDAPELSEVHYGNDRRYDGHDWDLVNSEDIRPSDYSEETLPEHNKAKRQLKGHRGKHPHPGSVEGGNNEGPEKRLGPGARPGDYSKAPYNGFPAPMPSGPSPIPKHSAGCKRSAPSKSRGNDSYILDKLEEVLDKNTF